MNRKGANLTGPLGGAGMVGRWGASSLIKSIQYGAVSTTSTANTTITAVDLANSYVIVNGFTSSYTGTNTAVSCVTAELTSSTNVQTENRVSIAFLGVQFVVIEFMPGVVKSIQKGTLSTTGVASGTATITSVNTAKTLLVQTGQNTDTGADIVMPSITLTNATTITQATNNPGTYPGALSRSRYAVVEFF